MKLIYQTNNFILYQEKPTIYSIHFSREYPNFINSIIKTNILRGAIVTNNYKTIRFYASSVISFSQYILQQNSNLNLQIYNSINLLNNLVTQFQSMIKYNNNQIFLGYEISNLLVIDENQFIYLNTELLSEINTDNINKNLQYLTITFPFSNDDFFLSPELLKISILPSKIYFKTCYFSMACLIIYSLTNNMNFYKEYIDLEKKKEKDISILFLNHIKKIYGTKLYWCLSRMISYNSIERNIIYI